MARKATLRAVVLGGGCLFTLLVGEVVLRASNVWVGRHSDTMFTVMEYDTILGWKMKPNAKATIDLVDVEGIPVRTNRLGFWDNEIDPKKPLNRCRIAFLGDSFTWGMGVRKEERFTSLVAAGNPEWESLNFAIPGFGTDQSFLVWRYTVRQYNPDLVILVIYQNDYQDNLYLVRYGRRKPYFALKEGDKVELRSVPVEPTNFWDDGIFHQAAPPYVSFFENPVQKRSRTIHWLAKNSDLVRLVYTLTRTNSTTAEAQIEDRRLKIEDRGLQDPATSDRRPATSTGASTGVELTSAQQMQVRLLGAVVQRLTQEVKAAGARFLVVLSGDPIPQYEAQKKQFSKAGIAYRGATTEVVASRLPEGRNGVYYAYSKHWTPSAHWVVGNLIAEAIREKRLCTRIKDGA